MDATTFLVALVASKWTWIFTSMMERHRVVVIPAKEVHARFISTTAGARSIVKKHIRYTYRYGKVESDGGKSSSNKFKVEWKRDYS